ncbi:MAG: F-box protein [Simkaniaceae bacterium]|nr:F-box protein [Simkaniaceae bacterium]
MNIMMIESPITEFPDELLLKVFAYVKDPTHSRVCRNWNRLYEDDSLYWNLSICHQSRILPGMYKQYVLEQYFTYKELVVSGLSSLKDRVIMHRKDLSLSIKAKERLQKINDDRLEAITEGNLLSEEEKTGELIYNGFYCLVGTPIFVVSEILVNLALPPLLMKEQLLHRKKNSKLEEVEDKYGKLSDEVFEYLQNRFHELHSKD